MSKTTLDLSTLSDIADGAHTVKVKAKADGYNDSEFSNEVSYTKAPAIQTFSGTIKNLGTDTVRYKKDNDTYHELSEGYSTTLIVRNDQKVRVENYGGGDFCSVKSSTGINIIDHWDQHNGWFTFSPTADNFTVEIEAV